MAVKYDPDTCYYYVSLRIIEPGDFCMGTESRDTGVRTCQRIELLASKVACS